MSAAGFRICPLEPFVQRLSLHSGKGAASVRVPIAERALIQRLERGAAVPDIARSLGRGSFRQGDNIVSLTGSLEQIIPEHAALAAEHFGPVFDRSAVQISMSGESDNVCAISVKGFALPGKAAPRTAEGLAQKFSSGLILFDVNFPMASIFMSTLESRLSGTGGRLVTALYGIARDLEMRTITWNVYRKRIDSLRFYYHIDFGRPAFDPEISDSWSLEL